MNKIASIINFGIGAALTFVITSYAATPGDIHREIKRTDEKEVRVKLDAAFGDVYVSKGEADKILLFDVRSSKVKTPTVDVDYRIKDGVGFLNLDWNVRVKRTYTSSSDEDEKNNDYEIEKGKWYIKLTDEVPINLSAELGVGRGEFDLGGLNLKRFQLSTGASSSIVSFNEPNKGQIEYMDIESGVSKFVGEKLCNANFKRMRFEGGIGSYTLDFGGDLKHEVDVDVNIGLGSITIIIPKDFGAKVHYKEGWFSNFSIDREFDEDNDGVYTTPNYETSKARINLFLDSGLGSIRVRRSK